MCARTRMFWRAFKKASEQERAEVAAWHFATGGAVCKSRIVENWARLLYE